MIARRHRLLARATLALALVVPSVAAADSIAVLGVEPGDAPSSLATALTDGLRKRAGETAGVKLVPSKDFMEMKMLFGCMDPATIATCLVPAGKSLGADKLIVGTLDQKKKGKKIKVSLKLVDSAAGTVVRSMDEEVAPSEVVGNASRWFSALVPPSAAPPPVTPPPAVAQKTTLEITSDPTGADVAIDGRTVGKTPITAPVFGPATHTVAVTRDGYDPTSREVKIKAGEELKLDFSLRAKAPPPVASVEPPTPTPTPTPEVPIAPAEHPGRTLKIAGVIGVLAGLVAIGIEIYTWQSYLTLQTDGHQKLINLRDTNGDYADNHKEWFQKPTCTVPEGVPTGSSTYKTYVADCNDGNTLASVSTALLIGGIVVGVAGIAAFGAGMYQSSQAEKASAPKTSMVPRLKVVSPVVSTSGGGVTAAFEF
jgi:PEGA domain